MTPERKAEFRRYAVATRPLKTVQYTIGKQTITAFTEEMEDTSPLEIVLDALDAAEERAALWSRPRLLALANLIQDLIDGAEMEGGGRVYGLSDESKRAIAELRAEAKRLEPATGIDGEGSM